MAKQIKTIIKLQIPGGQANPAPPVGPALGQHGINIGEFTQKFNEQTKGNQGELLPVEIFVYEDRSFDFKVKSPATSYLIKKMAGIDKASGNTPKEKAGVISKAQVAQIAKQKLPDLSAFNLEQAEKIIEGTARSMGVDIK